jgi:HEAT repeat protein
MGRRRRILLALVGASVVGIFCFFMLRSPEPEHGGKPLSRWVEQLFAQYPRCDTEAREALRAMGQPAVRIFTRNLDHAPSTWRRRLASMTAEIPLVNQLFCVAVFDRIFAAKALAEMGPIAKSAIPTLERAAKDSDRMLSLTARAALIRIRQESVEPHVAIYRQFKSTNSAQAAFLLMELGPYASPALPALLEGMKSTNWRVRFNAVMALPSIGYESAEYVPPVLRLLSDPEATVRMRAMDGLTTFGPLAKTALPEVRQSLRDTNQMVRASALLFLDRVLTDEEFSAVRDEVVRAKQDPDPTVSGMANYVLTQRPHGKRTDSLGR